MRSITAIVVLWILGCSSIAWACDSQEPLRFYGGENLPVCLSFNAWGPGADQKLTIYNECDSAAVVEAEDCPHCADATTIEIGESADFRVGGEDQQYDTATVRWTVTPIDATEEETGVGTVSYYGPNSCGMCSTTVESQPKSPYLLLLVAGVFGAVYGRRRRRNR